MQKVQGFTEQGNTTLVITGAAGTITRKVQGSFPLATITVFLAGTVTLAPIFADNAASPTAKANPFVSAADGTWYFYAPNGRYDVRFSGGGIAVPFTIGDIVLFDEKTLWIDASDAKYGAAGTDFGARINAALADLPPSGGVINAWGLQGTQPMTTTVNVTKPATILIGATTVVFSGTGAGYAFGFLAAGSALQGLSRTASLITVPAGVDCIIAGADDVGIRDITLRGPNVASSGFSGIDSGGRKRIILERITVEYFGSHGINTGGFGSYWTLNDVICQFNFDDGFLIGAQGHHMICTDCRFDDNGSNGFDANGSNNVMVGGSCSRNGNLHGAVGTDCYGALIQALNSADSGGFPTDANYNKLIGVEAIANFGPGIIIRGDAGQTANYNEILGCTSSGNTNAAGNGDGILIDNSTPAGSIQKLNRVEGCITIGNQRWGLACGGGTSVLEDNQFINNTSLNNGSANIIDAGVRTTFAGNKTSIADGTYRIAGALEVGTNVAVGGSLGIDNNLNVGGTTIFNNIGGITAASGILQVNGCLQVNPTFTTLINGANNNVPAANKSYVRVNGPTAPFSITGFTGGINGQLLLLYNAAGQTMTLANQNAGSTPANRIVTLTGADVALRIGANSFAILIYDSPGGAWVVASTY